MASATCAHIACSLGAMEHASSSLGGTSSNVGIYVFLFVSNVPRYGFQRSKVAKHVVCIKKPWGPLQDLLPIILSKDRDFLEVFSGHAEVSNAFRDVLCLAYFFGGVVC